MRPSPISSYLWAAALVILALWIGLLLYTR
jgi:hypothetical protein